VASTTDPNKGRNISVDSTVIPLPDDKVAPITDIKTNRKKIVAAQPIAQETPAEKGIRPDTTETKSSVTSISPESIETKSPCRWILWVVALVVLLLFFILWRRKKNRKKDN
jgi:hypothetical protein